MTTLRYGDVVPANDSLPTSLEDKLKKRRLLEDLSSADCDKSAEQTEPKNNESKKRSV